MGKNKNVIIANIPVVIILKITFSKVTEISMRVSRNPRVRGTTSKKRCTRSHAINSYVEYFFKIHTRLRTRRSL